MADIEYGEELGTVKTWARNHGSSNTASAFLKVRWHKTNQDDAVVQLVRHDSTHAMTPEEARSLAKLLNAAAGKAEQEFPPIWGNLPVEADGLRNGHRSWRVRSSHGQLVATIFWDGEWYVVLHLVEMNRFCGKTAQEAVDAAKATWA